MDFFTRKILHLLIKFGKNNDPLTVRGLMHQASAKPAAIIEIAASLSLRERGKGNLNHMEMRRLMVMCTVLVVLINRRLDLFHTRFLRNAYSVQENHPSP